MYTGRIISDVAELKNHVADAVQKIPQMLESVFGKHIALSYVETLMVAM